MPRSGSSASSMRRVRTWRSRASASSRAGCLPRPTVCRALRGCDAPRSVTEEASTMRRVRGLVVTLLILVASVIGASPSSAAPEGQMTWAVHISLAPTWFDPAETSGIITPFMLLYALHDALVKPMPGNPMAPSLAESWSATPDGLGYEFILRKGV